MVIVRPATAGRNRDPTASHSALELRPATRGVVDEERRAGLAANGHVDGLLGGEMAALGVVVARQAQPGLDQQEVHAAHGGDHAVARTGVPRVPEAAAVGRLDDDPPGGDVVAAADEADRERPDPKRHLRVVLAPVEGRIEEARTLGDRGRERVEPVPRARRQVHRERLRRGLAPREQVAEPDDVEVVVGMHVPDHDRREMGRVHQALQAPDHALPDVEQDGGRVPLDEVARGRPRLVRRGRAAAEHGQTEATRRVRGHRGHPTGLVVGRRDGGATAALSAGGQETAC